MCSCRRSGRADVPGALALERDAGAGRAAAAGGKKVPPHLQRFRADDLLTAVFPMQTACFEHRTATWSRPIIRWCGKRCTIACTR